MQQEINIVDVIWNFREDRIENIEHMKPQFPKFLFPIQNVMDTMHFQLLFLFLPITINLQI